MYQDIRDVIGIHDVLRGEIGLLEGSTANVDAGNGGDIHGLGTVGGHDHRTRIGERGIYDNAEHGTHLIGEGLDGEGCIGSIGHETEIDPHLVSVIGESEVGRVGGKIGLDISDPLALHFRHEGIDVVVAVGDGEGLLWISRRTTSEDVGELVVGVIHLLESVGNSGLFHDDLEVVMGILEDNGSLEDQVVIFYGSRGTLTRGGVDVEAI